MPRYEGMSEEDKYINCPRLEEDGGITRSWTTYQCAVQRRHGGLGIFACGDCPFCEYGWCGEDLLEAQQPEEVEFADLDEWND